MTLRWDGLQLDIPAGMEPVILDRGFVRLAAGDHEGGADTPPRTIDLRFGPEKGPFDPHRDGRRLLKASGLDGADLAPFRPSWACAAAGGIWSDGHAAPRLFVLHFRAEKGVVAALFPSPPSTALLQATLGTLGWAPPDAWRRWNCYDLAFETPPGFALAKASFRPGAFRIELTQGADVLAFDRLAPAGVHLSGESLAAWLGRFVQRRQGRAVAVTAEGPELARFETPVPPWRRILPLLPGGSGRVRGRARHDTAANRILVLTERGRPIPSPDFERIFSAYAATPLQS